MANPLPQDIPASFWNDYRTRIEDDLAQTKRSLAPLESGHMHLGERKPGEPWKDITLDMIAMHKRTIATFEAILAALQRKELP